MSRMATAVNLLWLASCTAETMRFRRDLHRPAACQKRILIANLQRNAQTRWGRAHGLDSITGPSDFAERHPITTWRDYEAGVKQIRAGHADVLTADPVMLLEPTSGSTTAAKLVPYTAALRAEFNRGLAPWITDLMRRRPHLLGGPAYWSVSPAGRQSDADDSAVRVGFNDDSEYLGGRLGALVGSALAVPASVRHIDDMETFRYVTLLCLLRARSLRLISVWHPSFLTLLLRALPTHWPSFLRDLEAGTVTPPGPLPSRLKQDLQGRMRPCKARALELSRLDPERPETLWPHLGLISCWADGHARRSLPEVRQLLPTVPIQPKGLIATEALITLPYAGRNLLAVRSHYYEFLAGDGSVHGVDDLDVGEIYQVLVTTGGGLYRYRLGDRVHVTEIYKRTPALRFIGREDSVSDLRGEKLSEGFVAGALAELLAGVDSPFAMLAPETRASTPGYTLYLQGPAPRDLAADLEEALCANPHYRFCVRAGQLEVVRVVRVQGDAYADFIARCRQLGQRPGDVKPIALSPRDDWSRHLQVEPTDHDYRRVETA